MNRRTLSFQATEEHHDLIHEAAKTKDMSVSDYARRILIDWAASDLGKSPPDLSCYEPDLVAQAAKKLGMTPREFASNAAREAASKALQLPTSDEIRASHDKARERIHGSEVRRKRAG